MTLIIPATIANITHINSGLEFGGVIRALNEKITDTPIQIINNLNSVK